MGLSAFDLATLGKLQEVASQVERHHLAVHRTISELVPWIPLFENLPTLFRNPQYKGALTSLRSVLPYNLALGRISAQSEEALAHLFAIRNFLLEGSQINEETPSEYQNHQVQRAIAWLDS